MKMKQTEIGLIPDDWEVKTLGEIGEPCMCKRILKEQTSSIGDIPFYKIGTFGGIPDAYISRELFEQYKEQYNYPKKGTLLLSAAGTIGRVVVFDGKDSYFQDSNIVWIDNDETKVTNDFLFYCYSRMQWKTEEGGIVSRLYNANLKSTSFIAPKSLAEQQRIAKALSDVDALISTTEKLIKKKKNIKQGTMQNLLTGKKRLPGFAKSTTYKQTELGPIPEDWEVKTLNELINDISDGPFGSNLKTEHYTTEREVRIIQLSNVGEDGWDNENVKYTTFTHAKEIQRCIVPYGSIVIAKMMPAGRAILCPNQEKMYILGSDCVRITPNSFLNSLFFMYFTKTSFYLNQIKENTQGSTRARTSVSKLKRIEIALPSKKEQTAIANVLSSMDKEIEILNTKLEKYRNLKTAMMQQLLTGKIRLNKGVYS